MKTADYPTDRDQLDPPEKNVFLDEDAGWLAKAGLGDALPQEIEHSQPYTTALSITPDKQIDPLLPVALVTGARRGIGRKVSEQLLSLGMHLIATCTKPAEVDKLQQALSSSATQGIVIVAVCDVRKEDQVNRLAEIALHYFGKLNILVNCAGIAGKQPSTVKTQSLEDWNDIIATNLTGTFLMCRAMIPLLIRAGGGRIVNLSGELGRFSTGMRGGGRPAYRISKAGVNALTLTLAQELVQDHIVVNAVDPGWVRTEMGGPQAPRTPDEAAADVVHAATLPIEEKLVGCVLRNRTPVDY